MQQKLRRDITGKAVLNTHLNLVRGKGEGQALHFLGISMLDCQCYHYLHHHHHLIIGAYSMSCDKESRVETHAPPVLRRGEAISSLVIKVFDDSAVAS